ncbi:FAD-dependent oxidoreductase [Poseidonibacter lekithochrous]|uniref:FAD-dependent oxidoreductase n=1 Tax=Poseidonibacter lekithochrous TaxID=1904463 RepID=UPI0008FC68F5|nr:FAD-dependent oxidoreductase [Poseidonibacter lekithochrous]QKJ23246.1 putative membrane protein [Poseidonibacter lekithochrous]
MQNSDVIIIGGGVAGLMAGIELASSGKSVVLLEKEDVVGGQCKTEVLKTNDEEYRFDYGGHRFITNNEYLLDFVEDVLRDELLVAQRSSVILHKNRMYEYPLNIKNLLKVAPISLLAGAFIDTLKIVLKMTKPNDKNFKTWITSRFGKTLYKNFFGPYTEKLWGIKPKYLSADWAGQRISLVDLKDVAKKLLFKNKKTARTYAKSYRYPKYGFGSLPIKMAKRFEDLGGVIITNAQASEFTYDESKIKSVKTKDNEYFADNIISTMPLNEMSLKLGFDSKLKFRSLRFLCIGLDIEDFSPHTWQYVSDFDLLPTRIQEPKRRSPSMSPKGKSSIMLEIPCNKGDKIWDMNEDELLEIVKKDLNKLKFDIEDKIVDYFSFTTEHAYTLMDVEYNEKRDKTITYLNKFENLIMAGRQGTYRYIFLDTAMETGLMAAQKLLKTSFISKEKIYNHRNEKTVIETKSVA